MSFVRFKHLAGTAGYSPVATDVNGVLRKRTPAEARADIGVDALIGLGETSTTAYRGDRGKTAYDHSQATGNPHGTTFAQIASKPTTLAGYGITDAMSNTEFNLAGSNFALIASAGSIQTYDAQSCVGLTASGGRLFWGRSQGTLHAGAGFCYAGSYYDDIMLYNLLGNFRYLAPIDARAGYKASGVQVVGSQQTGMGATLAAATIGGTYNSTTRAQIQALYDKVILLETKLKAHGLIAD